MPPLKHKGYVVKQYELLKDTRDYHNLYEKFNFLTAIYQGCWAKDYICQNFSIVLIKAYGCHY